MVNYWNNLNYPLQYEPGLSKCRKLLKRTISDLHMSMVRAGFAGNAKFSSYYLSFECLDYLILSLIKSFNVLFNRCQ